MQPYTLFWCMKEVERYLWSGELLMVGTHSIGVVLVHELMPSFM